MEVCLKNVHERAHERSRVLKLSPNQSHRLARGPGAALQQVQANQQDPGQAAEPRARAIAHRLRLVSVGDQSCHPGSIPRGERLHQGLALAPGPLRSRNIALDAGLPIAAVVELMEEKKTFAELTCARLARLGRHL